MTLPWNKHLHRASPRHWLLLKLAGRHTVILNANFHPASRLASSIQDGDLVAHVRGLSPPPGTTIDIPVDGV